MKRNSFSFTLFTTAVILFGAIFEKSSCSKFGGYTIPTANLAKSCKNHALHSIVYTDEQLKKGHKKMSDLFAYGRQHIKEYLVNKDVNELYMAASKGFLIGLPAIVSVLIGLLCIPGFIIFFFCRCCQNIFGLRKKRKAKKRFQEISQGLMSDSEDFSQFAKSPKYAGIGDKMRSKKGRACIWYCSLLIIFLLVCIGMVWAFFMHKSVRGLGKSECAFSHLFNDVKEGVKDGDIIFGGMDGLTYLFNSFKKEMGTLKVTTIPQLDLDKKGEALEEALKTYYHQFKGLTVSSCNPLKEGVQVQPDSIKNIQPMINEEIEEELSMLIGYSMIINLGGNLINEIAGGQIDEFSQAIDSFLAQIKVFKEKITGFEGDSVGTLNYDANEIYIDMFLVVVVGGTLITLFFFLILMTCSLKCRKCIKFSSFFQSILAISKIIFSTLVNIFVVAFIAFGIISSNLCYFGNLALTDKVWTQRIVGEQLMPYMELCLYPTSTGNLTTLLDPSQAKSVESIKSIITGFEIDISSLHYKDAEPPSLKHYTEDVLDKLMTYEMKDFPDSPEDSPEKQVLEANTITFCSKNEFEINSKKCTLSPISKLTDSVDYRNDEEYCLVPSFFGHSNIDSRYSTGKAACAAAAIPIYASLKKCVDEHDTLIANMKNSLVSMTQVPITPKKASVDIYLAVAQGAEEITGIQKNLVDTLDFVSSASKEGGLSALMNCTIVQRELKILLGNTCYDFGINFMYQTYLISILGPLLTLTAFCICCSVLKSEEKENARAEATRNVEYV